MVTLERIGKLHQSSGCSRNLMTATAAVNLQFHSFIFTNGFPLTQCPPACQGCEGRGRSLRGHSSALIVSVSSFSMMPMMMDTVMILRQRLAKNMDLAFQGLLRALFCLDADGGPTLMRMGHPHGALATALRQDEGLPDSHGLVKLVSDPAPDFPLPCHCDCDFHRPRSHSHQAHVSDSAEHDHHDLSQVPPRWTVSGPTPGPSPFPSVNGQDVPTRTAPASMMPWSYAASMGDRSFGTQEATRSNYRVTRF